MTDQGELFPVPPDTPLPRARTLREIDAANRPRWTKYRPVRRVPCDECILIIHEAGGAGVPARSARWRLSIVGKNVFLCDNHADQRRN